MTQRRWYEGPAEPYGIKDLRLAVVVDYKTMKATTLAFDDASYDPRGKRHPRTRTPRRI